MALADDLLPVIDAIRAIPGQLGLRPNRVYLVFKESSGGAYPGDGTIVASETELLVGGQPPKVRSLNDEEIALSGLGRGSVRVGRCTPDFTTGGLDIGYLIGSYQSLGNTLQVKIVSRSGTTLYNIKSVDDDRAMHYEFVCEPESSEGA